MKLKDVDDPTLVEILESFKEKGGVLEYSIVRIDEKMDEYQCHYHTALHILNISAEKNFEETGLRISPDEFFGPYFKLSSNQLVVLGKTGTKQGALTFLDSYYYHTDKELPENKIDYRLLQSNGEFATQGYADAFMSPPHRMWFETNAEAAEFFLKTNSYLFSDFTQLVIYKWSIDCSNFFDAGKEWWGSFFWTVYNPTKDWYIGIAASTTD